MPVESRGAVANALSYLEDKQVRVEKGAHTETHYRDGWWLVLVQLARNQDNWATVGVLTNGLLLGIKDGHHPNISREELEKK